MATTGKDVIYIDIDDEITAIIDKLRSSNSKIVALVLPKRATVFQSSVNMKLLKKAANDTKKRLVLITSEANLLPLAGSIGLYVAKTLQSKPAIPGIPDSHEADEAIDTVEDPGESQPDGGSDFDKAVAAEQPVGDLAGLSEEPKKAKPELTPMPIPLADEAEETVELDNTTKLDSGGDETEEKTEAVKKPKKDKNLKVPNFNKFRLRLIIGAVVLILLIVGWILANIILPKASIIISTETSSLNSSLTLNLSSAATTVDAASSTVPAHSQQVQKSVTETVNSTGQQNNGNVASGTVSMTAQECGSSGLPSDVPSGSGLSYNGFTYITQKNTSFTYQNLKNGCANFQATDPTPITAQGGGANYNTPTSGSVQFSVADRSDVTATGSASGGTDDITQIVTQTDINNATAKLTAPDTSTIKTGLESSLSQAGYYPIPATFSANTPSTTSSATAGTQANSVTVTQTTSYTMLGVHETDLESLLNSSIDSQINTAKQSILNNGFSAAAFTSANLTASPAQITMQSSATIGPDLSVSSLKSQVAGKKAGQVESLLNADPGVTTVKVNLSPFWVSSVPTKTSKITIKLQSSSHASNS